MRTQGHVPVRSLTHSHAFHSQPIGRQNRQGLLSGLWQRLRPPQAPVAQPSWLGQDRPAIPRLLDQSATPRHLAAPGTLAGVQGRWKAAVTVGAGAPLHPRGRRRGSFPAARPSRTPILPQPRARRSTLRAARASDVQAPGSARDLHTGREGSPGGPAPCSRQQVPARRRRRRSRPRGRASEERASPPPEGARRTAPPQPPCAPAAYVPRAPSEAPPAAHWRRGPPQCSPPPPRSPRLRAPPPARWPRLSGVPLLPALLPLRPPARPLRALPRCARRAAVISPGQRPGRGGSPPEAGGSGALCPVARRGRARQPGPPAGMQARAGPAGAQRGRRARGGGHRRAPGGAALWLLLLVQVGVQVSPARGPRPSPACAPPGLTRRRCLPQAPSCAVGPAAASPRSPSVRRPPGPTERPGWGPEGGKSAAGGWSVPRAARAPSAGGQGAARVPRRELARTGGGAASWPPSERLGGDSRQCLCFSPL